MTDNSLGEILSGPHEPTERAELHSALDALLDAADEDGGRLDGPAFWAFVAEVARGRGIADEIAEAAAQHIATSGAVPDNPAGLTKSFQWAILSAMLRRVTAFPGEILPREFLAAALLAAVDNVVVGKGELGGGEQLDVLGLGTQRGKEWHAERRSAQRVLVGVVYFQAELAGTSVASVRKRLLPEVPDRTWKDWTRQVALAKRVAVWDVGNKARAAARRQGDASPYLIDDAEIARLIPIAWHPR